MLYSSNINFKSYTYHGNLGMGLENDLNETNKYYLNNDIAVIHKKPTYITINKVDYKSRKDAKITEAYFKTPSTTDYNGIYKGKYIDFEAKETKNKNYFPLNNIHQHQINHLRQICKHGGIGFLIVRFTTNNQTFLLKAEDLFNFLKISTRKSIPINYFQEKGFIIKDKYCPRVDYLKIVDTFLGGKKNEKIN